ncbi:hypothetical protein RLEG12_08910 (plasmid) [Rhizobium leguminosarum bv. trifolii CB782]|nr:hypothetical protein RLEG12_08910 [Rhizobium leguminosarum bv. trifolii CB782]
MLKTAGERCFDLLGEIALRQAAKAGARIWLVRLQGAWH